MTLLALYCVASILLSLFCTGEAKGITTTLREEALQCYVDAGVLVAFPGNTSLKRQQDVLNSLLFAQLAAGKNYSRENDPEGWFSYFEYVLQNIGWALTSTKFDVVVGDDYFVLASLALNQMVETEHWVADVETFRGFLNALHSLPDEDTSIQLLYENSYNKSTNAISLVICSFLESPDNKVQLSLLTFSFKGLRDTTHRYLFYVYRAQDVVFSKAEATTMALNDDVFKKVKQTVIEKLGDRVKTMISQVKIPEK